MFLPGCHKEATTFVDLPYSSDLNEKQVLYVTIVNFREETYFKYFGELTLANFARKTFSY